MSRSPTPLACRMPLIAIARSADYGSRCYAPLRPARNALTCLDWKLLLVTLSICRYILIPIHRHLYRNSMRHDRHRDGADRRSAYPEDLAERRRGEHHHHHHHHNGRRGGGRHGSRAFDYGELRLLVLALIAEQPRHGYELMKSIEERMAGTYSPSPGVIYPTLSWLEDMGYAEPQAEEAGRKRYRITAEGQAFLVANRAAADELQARASADGPDPAPAPVVRAMENLRLAMRLRLRRGAIDQMAGEAIAAALDAAAQTVERS
jgi:DNA-binding PadR family transcriptional regulator